LAFTDVNKKFAMLAFCAAYLKTKMNAANDAVAGCVKERTWIKNSKDQKFSVGRPDAGKMQIIGNGRGHQRRTSSGDNARGLRRRASSRPTTPWLGRRCLL
jgi:hypothetical protein